MASQPGSAQRHRDDILEALYWLSGEGIEPSASARTLASLVAASPEAVAGSLRALAELGWVEAAGDDRFRLTGEGRREAGRRFAESFADMAGRQGHGVCDDDCDCHDSAEAARDCAEHRHAGHAH